jgi:hypothetical protein
VGKFAEFMTAPPVQEGYEVIVQGWENSQSITFFLFP